MNPILYVSTDIKKAYYDESFLGKIRDRLCINLQGESFIRELNLKIARIKLPPNFNPKAYNTNMNLTRRFAKKKIPMLAPKTYRYFDYNLLNDFQKNLFAYGVVNSIKLLLRVRSKSIKSSCIAVYDAADFINERIIFELAKECRYIILVSKSIDKIMSLQDYVTANYGVAPIVTKDYSYAMSKADFIISSKGINVNNLVWYINNLFVPKDDDNLKVNDISFSVPWEVSSLEFGFELLGAVLSQMQEKDVEASLKYNGIYLDKIKFNDELKV